MNPILIIKLGALGDFFAATSAFEAIANYHSQNPLVLLTTKPYVDFAHKLGYFDKIWVDERPKLYELSKLWVFRKKFRRAHFERVYDLQMVDRTNFYYHLIGPGKRPEWVGTASGASHHYALPKKLPYHQERFKALLEKGGISSLPSLNLTRLAKNIHQFPLRFPYVLLVPGASPAHRPVKCWPLERYGEIAKTLVQEGFTPVIVGGADEDNYLIKEICPEVIDLTGKTQLIDMITLATHAAFAIGNDTGPMHIAATCLCPVLVLFFTAHDPSAGGARGIFYRHFKAENKMSLSSQEVLKVLPQFIEFFKNKTFPS